MSASKRNDKIKGRSKQPKMKNKLSANAEIVYIRLNRTQSFDVSKHFFCSIIFSFTWFTQHFMLIYSFRIIFAHFSWLGYVWHFIDNRRMLFLYFSRKVFLIFVSFEIHDRKEINIVCIAYSWNQNDLVSKWELILQSNFRRISLQRDRFEEKPFENKYDGIWTSPRFNVYAQT